MWLAAHFGQHVIYDLAVLMLWAKQNNVGILGDLDRVSGRPIKKVPAFNHFIRPVGIGDRDFTVQHVAPVRGLTQVAFEALKQWRDIGTGAERKVLAADRAVPSGIAEIRLLASDRTRHIDPDWNILLCDAHR